MRFNVTQLVMARVKQAVRKRAEGPGYHRRANGEGTVFQRDNGQWVARIESGKFDKNGYPLLKSFTGKTQGAVLARLNDYRHKRDAGLLVDYSTQTLAEYSQGFLERYCAGKAANTQRNIRTELTPVLTTLGGMRLQQIKPKHIQAALEHMGQSGYRRQEGGKVWPYSARSLSRSLMLLRALFDEALRLQVVPTNPAAAVRPPAPTRRTADHGRALEPDELAALNTAFATHNMGVFFRLLLSTGLRKGEALALMWADIDLNRPAYISVQRTWQGKRLGFTSPKTIGSRRRVPLPESMVEVLRVLKATTQAALQQDISKLHLFGYADTNLPWDVNSPNQVLDNICTKVGVRKIRVHDLRHTYGSHLLAQGVDIAVVSRYMGHASINITLGVYRSVMKFELGEVPDVLELALQRASQATPAAQPN